MIDTTQLYAIIADTMPTEGRDFTISVNQPEGQKPQLSIKALTPVGRGFVPALIERLAGPLTQQGIEMTSGEPVNPELLTVRMIRERTEHEATEALKAKIEAVRQDLETKRAALNELASARITQHGEQSTKTEEERKAQQTVNETQRVLWKLTRLEEILGPTRSKLDAAAHNIAVQDAKDGKSWAIDMDAPLLTLFERQDAIQAFKDKEIYVRRLAALDIDMDVVRHQALEVTKRFIMDKSEEQS